MTNANMTYSLSERTFIHTEILRHGKQLSVSYLLLIFLGFFGLHHIYLKGKMLGITKLLLTLTGLITFQLLIGYLLLLFVALWLIVDAFLMFKKVERINSQLEQSLKRYVDQLKD
jgi:TM2 domain-containing membrane protein YozV